MMSTLEIDGRTFSSIKEAAQLTSYSRDYITRLAREGKIAASYVGRQWFIDVTSLKNYAENIALEHEARKRLLSEERKQERRVREAVESLQTLHIKKSKTLHVRSVVAASLVLGFGLLSGLATYQVISFSEMPPMVVAKESNVGESTRVAITPQAESMPAQAGAAAVSRATPSTVTTEAEAVAEASATQRPLGDVTEGVLLLPQSGSVAEVPALFSDTVEVRQLSDGTSVVVRVDAAGNQIGNEVPFVVVPVTQSEI